MPRGAIPGHAYPVLLLYLPARNDKGILQRHLIPGCCLGQHAGSTIRDFHGMCTPCIAELEPGYPRERWGNRPGTDSKTQPPLVAHFSVCRDLDLSI